MTTTQMWILFAVVAALILMGSALAHKKFTVREVVLIGVMAALSFVAYTFLRIPNVFGTKSSFHLGNTFTALTALLLDGVSGGLAGAIGLSLADITAGDPGYAITTFVLKFIIGLVCGTVAHRLLHLEKKGHTGSRGKYVAAVTAASFSGPLVNVFTDPLIGYVRDRYIFGMTPDLSAVFMKVASGVTLANSILSCVCCVVIYLALRPALERAGLLPQSREDTSSAKKS